MKNIITTIILLSIIIAIIGAVLWDKKPNQQTLYSPNGKWVLNTDISGKEAGIQKQFCVKLILNDNKTNQKIIFQTSASDAMKWSIGWYNNDIIVLQSSDIGARSYNLSSSQLIERLPNESEILYSENLYKTKYKK